MEHSTDPISRLSDAECWEHLRREPMGRLVTRVGEVMDITPVNFVTDGESIVLRTAPGNKLSELSINSSVLFEVDHFDTEMGWSVIVRGQARAVEEEAEILHLEQLPLRPFIPTLKPVFVRITADSLSGRAFRFGTEPRREDQQDG